MITALLAALIGIPTSVLIIMTFFDQDLHLSEKLISKITIKFISLHCLTLCGGVGGVYTLLGHAFETAQWILLMAAIALTDLSISWGLRRK